MKRNLSIQLAPLRVRHNLVKLRKNLNKSEIPKEFTQFRIRQTPVSNKNLRMIDGVFKKTKLEILFPPELKSLDEIKSEIVEDTSSSSSDEDDEKTKNISGQIVNEFIAEHLEISIREGIFESFNEIAAAALILHANSLLDKLIDEFIDKLAQHVVLCSINELKNSELFEISQMIEKKICKEQVKIISDECTTELFAKLIFRELLNLFDFTTTAIEAISEEIIYYKKLFLLIFHSLIESILAEEWLEILVEDEISFAKISQNFKLLPLKSQKEINDNYLLYKIDLILEEIYFDILNLYVSNVWTMKVIEYTILDEDPDINILMPINISIKRKQTTLSLKSNYYLSITR